MSLSSRRHAALLSAVCLIASLAMVCLTGSSQAAASAPLTDAQAAAQAAATGQPVLVTADTTASSTTTANPDGTFTMTQSAIDTRLWRDGAWVNVDPSLHANPDGSLSPQATTADLVLSGGGDGPLAVVTYHNQRLSLGFPVPLPAPTVDGNVAVYAEVYPSVDLIVTVDDQGGFSDVLEIKTAQAATNPALATIVMPASSSSGLTIHADTGGNLSADTPSGATVFAASAPLAWDSASTVTPPPAVEAPGPAPEDPATGAPEASTAAAPGEGAHVSRLATTVADSAISLGIPPALLTSSSTVFPVFADPGFTVDTGHSAWAMAQYCSTDSGWANTTYWEPSTLQVGYDGWSGTPCAFKSRAYIRMAMSSHLTSRTTIYSASITFHESYSPSCSLPSGHDGSVQAWITGPISSSTDWNNKPSDITKLGVNTHMYGYTTSCPANTIEFTVPNATVKADVGSSITFGLQADDESDKYGWKKFSPTATLSVTYDNPPNTPTSPTSSPGAGGCVTNPAGDIVGNTALTLSAGFTDPDSDDTLKATFEVFDYNTSTTVYTSSAITVANGTAQIRIPAATVQAWHSDGSTTPHDYSWYTWTTDAASISGTHSTTCSLDYDPSQVPGPDIGTISIDGATIPAAHGSATISAGGPAFTGYTYQIDDAASGSELIGGDCTLTSCTLDLPTVSAAGPHTLTVYGTTSAGTLSQPAIAIFTTLPNGTVNPDGDLNSDGHPDLVAGGGPGTSLPSGLWQFKGTGTASPAITGTDIGVHGDGDTTNGGPDNYDQTLTTIGNFTGNGLGDVLVYHTTTGDVRILPGNGVGATLNPNQSFTITEFSGGPQLDDPVGNPLTGTDGGTPVTLTSLIADGDANGDQTGPDLLATTSDGHLWLFPALFATDNDVTYDSAQPLAGPDIDGTDWTGTRLAAGIDSSGYPALYAYDATGSLSLYTSDDPANQTVGASLSTKTTITATDLTNPATIAAIAGDDINSDGRPDLWALHTNGGISTELLDSGGTTLTAATAIVTTPTNGWALAEGSGTTATDIDSTSPATLTNATLTSDPARGNIANFPDLINGVGGNGCARATSGGITNTDNNYSISLWVKVDNLDTTQVFYTQTGTNTWNTEIYYSTAFGWVFNRETADSTSPGFIRATSTSTPVPGLWTHLVGVYTASTKQLALYVNGVNTPADDATDSTPWSNVNTSLAIGCGVAGTSGSPSQSTTGDISDVTIYNTALTQAQITTLHTNGQ